mgnify:CR=1 FL=1
MALAVSILAVGVAVWARAVVQGGHLQEAPAPRAGRHVSYWDNGQLKSDVTYRNDAYEGDYRTYYASGAPYEVRHYVNGHEQGRQQSWTEAGVLYLNYEVRDDRRFGLVNPSPCNTVGDAAAVVRRDRVGRRPPELPELRGIELAFCVVGLVHGEEHR